MIARGIDLEAVTPRFYSKSIGCCKKFPGKNCITGIKTLIHWLTELSTEICDRMEKDEIENNRKAKQMVVSYIQEINGDDVSSSRSMNLLTNEPEQMAKYALELIKKNTEQFFKMPNNEHLLNNPIKFLGISIGKFETIENKQQNTLQQMFMNQTKKKIQQQEQKNVKEIVQEVFDNNSTENDFEAQANTKKEEELKQSEEKSMKNSFFAAHLRKNNNEVNNTEKKDNVDKKEIKSFFLNTIKINTNNVQNGANEIELESESSEKFDNNYKINDNGDDCVIDQNKDSIPQKCPKLTTKIDENTTKNIKKNNNQSNYDPIPGTSIQKPNENDINENFNECSIMNTERHYLKNYVEFAVPDATEDDYINCDKCGKKILSYALQTHMDYHYAFEVSQEQRANYRQEILSKVKSSTKTSPPAKKLKTNPNSNLIANKNSNKKVQNKTSIIQKNVIDKFLIKKDDSSNIEPKELCTECNIQIPITKLLEHQDYHTAKRLQIEMNCSTLTSSSSSSLSLPSPTLSTTINENDDKN